MANRLPWSNCILYSCIVALFFLVPSRPLWCRGSGSGRRGFDLRGIDGVHVVVLHQVAQRLPVLPLVVTDVDEDVVERTQFRAAFAVGPLFRLVLDGTKQIKEEGVVQLVVLAGNLGDWFGLEAVFVLGGELAVGVKGVVLDELRQVVGRGFVPGVDPNDVPIIEKGHGLCQRPVDDVGIPAQAFHDQQVVELVVRLGVVGAHSFGHAVVAFSKGFPEVHDAQVGKIGDPGHGFQDVKPCKITLVSLHGVQETNDVVDRVDEFLVEAVDSLVHSPGGQGRSGDSGGIFRHDGRRSRQGFFCGRRRRRVDRVGGIGREKRRLLLLGASRCGPERAPTERGLGLYGCRSDRPEGSNRRHNGCREDDGDVKRGWSSC
mmetsp:Transcript_74742/g.151800  ORF Transcript_74742/g.151800 Transcript_74742/m.151800 type:complete len:374 (+) Transcript_74742:837-1958(+)